MWYWYTLGGLLLVAIAIGYGAHYLPPVDWDYVGSQFTLPEVPNIKRPDQGLMGDPQKP